MPPSGGVIVKFCDNATKALIWKAPMHYIPGENDVIEWLDALDVLRTYEVKSITHTFNSPNPAGSYSGVLSCTDAKHTPTVYVTEV